MPATPPPLFQAHDVAGITGVVLIIGAYFLLQSRRMSGTGLAFPLINAVGAALILVSLTQQFNLAAFMVEVFWLLISLFGVTRWVLERRRFPRSGSERPEPR
jgi:hypothetical protein